MSFVAAARALLRARSMSTLRAVLARPRARALPVAIAISMIAACGGSDETSSQTPVPVHSGDIVTWAGTGTQGQNGEGKDRRAAWLNQPMELVFAADGGALVVDWNNHAVRRIEPSGVVNTVIGQALPGDWPCQVPSDPANCRTPLSASVSASELALNHPMDVVFDAQDGSFAIAAWHNHKVLQYSAPDQQVAVLAGAQKPGGSGDGGPGAQSLMNFPSSLVRQSDGSLLVSDERNNRVRRLANDAAHTVTTVAGTIPPAGSDGDGLPATTVQLALTTSDEISGADNPPPGGALALDAHGTLYLADTFHHCVRLVTPGSDGVIGAGDPNEEILVTVAGTCGHSGYTGDSRDAKLATLNHPYDLELGPDGALYIADAGNHAVRRVDLSAGTITTIAGTGQPGFSGDHGPATHAKLREPYGLAFDSAGALYIVDTLNNRIRRIEP